MRMPEQRTEAMMGWLCVNLADIRTTLADYVSLPLSIDKLFMPATRGSHTHHLSITMIRAC